MTPPLALDERRATAIVFDAQTDIASVEVGSGKRARHRTIQATVLLDAAGLLVGLDLRDDNGIGCVVMLGPHEAVGQVVPQSVEVHEDAAGEPIEVRIPGARKAIRADRRNPYV